MNLVFFITVAVLAAVTRASDVRPSTCEIDAVLSIDTSLALSREQFERTKVFVTNVYKRLGSTENSVKLGLMSFAENSATSLVSFVQSEHGHVVETEIKNLGQKTGRPSLMKSLQLMQSNFFKAGNGERPSADNVGLLFMSGEPSNVIGCLKIASQLRSANVKLVAVVFMANEATPSDTEPHHTSPNNKQRDFINFLTTVVGNSMAVHVMDPNSPNFLERADEIANFVCPSSSFVAPSGVITEAKPADEPVLKAEKKSEAEKVVVIDNPESRVSIIVEEPSKPKHHERKEPVVIHAPRDVEEPVVVVKFEPAFQEPEHQQHETAPVEPEEIFVEQPETTVLPPPTPAPQTPAPRHHEPKPVAEPPRKASEKTSTNDFYPMPQAPVTISRMFYRTTTTPTTTTTTTLSPQDLKAIAFCQKALNEAEVMLDQFFGNPDDCTSFFQCSLETGALTAKLFLCQPGMFWKEHLKQCMPGTGCKDRCEEPAIARRGVYADPGNCRRWFQCANSISYPACCPVGTSYDEVLTTCVTTTNCYDDCETGPSSGNSEEEEPPTTAEPRFDANGCHDRWGSLKRPNRQNPAKYNVHIGKGHFVAMTCPLGTRFDLIECDCIPGEPGDGAFDEPPPVEDETEEIHCLLYFPFDENLNDYSNQRLWVTPVVFGGAWVDQRVRVYGEGSARISSSGIACPGLSGADFRDHLTAAMWVKCYSATAVCHGDLLANGNAKAAPTVRMSLKEMQKGNGDKQVAVELSILVASAEEPITLTYPIVRPSLLASWTHLALRYDGYALSLFVNGTLCHEVGASGNIGVSMTQIVVAGAVASPHQFRGYIDEVLLLPVALDDVGMKGLLRADMARLAHDGWIKV